MYMVNVKLYECLSGNVYEICQVFCSMFWVYAVKQENPQRNKYKIVTVRQNIQFKMFSL